MNILDEIKDVQGKYAALTEEVKQLVEQAQAAQRRIEEINTERASLSGEFRGLVKVAQAQGLIDKDGNPVDISAETESPPKEQKGKTKKSK